MKQAERVFRDPENRLRQTLKGQWGLFLRGRLSLDGDFNSQELRELADIVDAMQAEKMELVEIARNPDWDDEDDNG